MDTQRDSYHAQIFAAQCPGAYHELDNEPAGVGSATRTAAARFAEATAIGDFSIYAAPSGACEAF